MLYQRRNLTNWQISVFLITVRKQKNKLSRKEKKKSAAKQKIPYRCKMNYLSVH